VQEEVERVGLTGAEISICSTFRRLLQQKIERVGSPTAAAAPE
jgi:hypothetical protein